VSPDFVVHETLSKILCELKSVQRARGQFFKTSIGANSRIGARKAKSNTGVGANFSRRRKNPFKKLLSGAAAWHSAIICNEEIRALEMRDRIPTVYREVALKENQEKKKSPKTWTKWSFKKSIPGVNPTA
jgi:hypothetical protein